jgi:uncharacterized membrane protein YfcA
LYLRGKAVSKRIVAYLAGGSVAAIVFGGYLIATIRGTYGISALNFVVGVNLRNAPPAGAGCFLTASEGSLTEATSGPPPMFPTFSLPGFVIGFAVNIISVGAGSLLMPYLMRRLKPAREMVGTDIVFGFFTTVAGALLQLGSGSVLPWALLYLLVGSVAGTHVGMRLNDRIRLLHMRRVLGVAIMAAGP